VADDFATPAGAAEFLDGTNVTLGLTGQADSRAQLHHSLIKIGGVRVVKQLLSGVPQFLARMYAAKQTPEDPCHIAIEHRDWFIECNARDGCRGVTADAGEGAPAFGILRKVPCSCNDLCGRV
jgi:hypothetical protein